MLYINFCLANGLFNHVYNTKKGCGECLNNNSVNQVVYSFLEKQYVFIRHDELAEVSNELKFILGFTH